MENNKMLEIRNLHVQYLTDEAVVYALNGFDLDLHEGEILGIVGETGAGKTTMALSILNLLPAGIGQITKGSIEYKGKDLVHASNAQMREIRGAEISMIFQDPMTALNPILTVGDQIYEVLDLHFPKMTQKEKGQKVSDIMELVGLPASRKTDFPHQLSGGMKQRIVIAMALVAEPKLLIADEPTTALDVTIQAQILELMKELKQHFNSAMLYITHDLGVINEFCDNVAVVYAGEVVERGTVEQIFTSKINHPYTEGLFACIPTLETDAKRLTPIPGYPVDSTNLPEGCMFADRCSKCSELCRKVRPPMYEVEGHWIKCHLYRKEKDVDE